MNDDDGADRVLIQKRGDDEARAPRDDRRASRSVWPTSRTRARHAIGVLFGARIMIAAKEEERQREKQKQHRRRHERRHTAGVRRERHERVQQ